MDTNNNTLSIIGMTCASCANAVERSVSKIDGVSGANVNFATEKLVFTYDQDRTSIEEIKGSVKDAGYEAKEDVKSSVVTIPVSGMTCASCAANIDKAIKKTRWY